ncbi:MAG: hypothetical protein MJZ46_01445, partial [Bacteroidales bacterium]|nr:hypothetical protein [Bacteroidales bacterium]
MELGQKNKYVLYGCFGLFLLINFFCLWKQFFYFSAVSVVLLVLYLLVFRLDLLMYGLAFVTPLSIVISDEKIQLGLSLPSEFIMIAVTLLFFCRILYDWTLDWRLVTHPVSTAIP